jgi:hypothetical protein
MIPPDRDVRFVLLAETHARQFLPVLARLERRLVYMGDEPVSSGRLGMIRAVLARSPIAAEIEARSVRRLFHDLLHEGPGATFVFPVRVGLPAPQSRGYGRDPLYEVYQRTPLAELPNRLVILNETSIHKLVPDAPSMARPEPEGAYREPHAHAILCRTGAEARQVRAAYAGRVAAPLVGDLFLDEVEWPREYRWATSGGSGGREGGRAGGAEEAATGGHPAGLTVAFLTSTQRTDAGPTLERMLADLDRLRETGYTIDRLLLKEHPGTEDPSYRALLVDRTRSWGAELEVCPLEQLLEEVADRSQIALVQDSLSSHLTLRRHGVESFLYLTHGGLGLDREFLEVTHHPPSTLGDRLDGRYDPDAYDRWIADTYRLDGLAVERFFSRIEDR